MSNVFGPKKPLFGPYTYRVKQNSNGDTLIAVYHGSKRIAHIDAFWAYSMRAIEEHEEEEARRGTRRRLVCATDLRALGAEGRYPNVLAVGHAFMDDDAYKGKGIGRAMYEAMMVEGFAVRQTRIGGQPGPMFFIPDECKGSGNTSADAKRVWASLARDYPSQGTSIRVDAPPVIGSRAKVNPRRRNPDFPKAYYDLVALAPSLQDRIYDYFKPLRHLDGANEMLARMLRDAGYRVIGMGGVRVVVDVGEGFAAKVACDAYGDQQNRAEAAFWKAHPLPDLIMPVHAFSQDGPIKQDGTVLLTERAETPVTETEARAGWERLAKHPQGRLIGETEYAFQWGRHGGKVKLLDYGDNPLRPNPRRRNPSRSRAKVNPRRRNPEDDYRMRHRPPEDGPLAHELGKGDYMPADVLVHPEWYTGFSPYLPGFWRTVRAAQGRRGATLRIYRALPQPHATFREGDWVTLSLAYAKDHLESNLDGEGHIIAADVPAGTLRFAGDDLMEWGYWGPTVEGTPVRRTNPRRRNPARSRR